MRRSAISAGAAIAVLISGAAISAAERTAHPAAPLVQAALEAEERGDESARERLLAEALRVDPDYPPARWHAGQVRVGGRWQDVAEVERQSQRNAKLAQYRELRAQFAGSPEGSLALARWCRRQGLDDAARAHWLQVLEASPRSAEALRALDAQWHRGQLVSRESAQARQRSEQAERRSLAEWKSKLDAWRQSIERGAPPERRQAREELSAVRDELAVPALVASLPQGNLDVALAKVEALSKIESSAATDALLGIVTASRSPALRTAASRALNDRPRDYVVVRLMQAMAFPIETTASIEFTPLGFHLRHTLAQDSVAGEREVTYHTQFEQRFRPVIAEPGRTPVTLARIKAAQATAANYAGWAAERTEQRVRQWNDYVAERNDALAATLKQVTGQSLGANPRAWWNWWYGQTADYRPSPETRSDVYEYWNYTHLVPVRTPGSCFAAGTLVQTLTGPQAIETIEPGDQVLSQDPLSGELDYATVLSTTLRPNGAMVRLSIGGEEVLATEVHPFWVTGQGWKIARSLAPGDRLHTLGGAVGVDDIEPAGEHDAYNLVVEGAHTYFVGQARTLVHDVTLEAPTDATIPGLASR